MAARWLAVGNNFDPADCRQSHRNVGERDEHRETANGAHRHGIDVAPAVERTEAAKSVTLQALCDLEKYGIYEKINVNCPRVHVPDSFRNSWCPFRS
jgi:hypothetical protein